MTDKSVSKAGQSKVLRLGLLGVAVLALGACSNIHSSTGTYDPRFMNYDQRHALSLRQQEATLPLLVGANATGLTSGDRTALSGFMQSYAAQGEGALRIRVPQGSANARAATNALGDIHDVVSHSGGNPSAIRVERYQVGNTEAHAPIIMVYDRLEAVTNPCGTWADPFNPALEQSDFYNFGCASQANLGASLADPRDLVRPRGVGHPDAGRRAEVLAAYRRGEPTATQRSDEAEAAVAQVGE
ncbi:MAG: CpaD family pilus assembly protein [Hyphomicrobiales bacterium]